MLVHKGSAFWVQGREVGQTSEEAWHPLAVCWDPVLANQILRMAQAGELDENPEAVQPNPLEFRVQERQIPAR